MTADRDSVLRARRLRWEFLFALYEHLQTLPSGQIQGIMAFEVAAAIGVTDRNEADRVSSYLEEAGLIQYVTSGPTVAITKAGMDEVEQALAEPDAQTEHFPAVNVMYVAGNIHSSQFQLGSHHSSQTSTWGSAQLEQLSGLLPELRAALASCAPDDRQAKADLETVEQQLKSPQPRQSVIKECLASVRGVLEKAGATVLAAKVLQWMHSAGLY
jgi:hypothetical protein